MSFILNFVSGSSRAEGWQREDLVSCNHYSIYSYPDGRKAVTVYPTATNVDGVEYTIMSDVEALVHEHPYCTANEPLTTIGSTPYYHRCFVQNQDGKTVNTVYSRHGRLVDGTALRAIIPNISNQDFCRYMTKLNYILEEAQSIWDFETSKQ